VVAAAGNQGTVGSSVVTRHPWVLPVAACDLQGRPLSQSTLSGSVGKRGLLAPGEGVTSLEPDGQVVASGGTSVAAPFATGSLALLWSEFPLAPASELVFAMRSAGQGRRASIAPPLLNAWAAYQFLLGRGHKLDGATSQPNYERARTE
jgi:subtilisin family serine protease